MKVLERAVIPDGTKIQIEDWSGDYSFHRFADFVAAYPVARGSIKGSTFRAYCQFENAQKASEAFLALKSGEKQLDDFPFLAKSSGNDIPFRQYVPLVERYFEGW